MGANLTEKKKTKKIVQNSNFSDDEEADDY